MNQESQHIPVLVTEVVDLLRAREGGTFLDCTFGGGGHSRAILDANQDNIVVAIDRDQFAIDRGSAMIEAFGSRLQLFCAAFSEISEVIPAGRYRGVLADLGTSTDQLFDSRGFSFRDEVPLDMRMDSSQDLTAAQVVNGYSLPELRKVLQRGGIRQNADRLAKAIVDKRPFDSASSLSECVEQAIGYRARGKSAHPATVVFQAIRIEVNQEFLEIESLLEQLSDLLDQSGRFVCISFHSLEDQIVTKKLRSWEGRDFSALDASTGNPQALGKLVTRKAVVATEAEQARNPRSRSARLRAFEFGAGSSRSAQYV